ncbi:MAG: HEPN domain-containing protein [Candidatus Methanoperedens sp.]
MMREAQRWLSQAKSDLEAAKWNAEGKFYAHACFLSQQAAEKALKAYLYSIGKRKLITHSTYTLAKECAQENSVFNSILSICAELDKNYIPSRYPNGLPDSIPSEVYLKQDAQVSINHSEKILEIVSKLVKN